MKRTASVATLAAVLVLAPVTVAGTATAATYYPNCHAALAAGVSNIHSGEPGYRPALDEDHDGVACEQPGSAAGGSGSGGSDGSTSHPVVADEGSGSSSASSSSSGSSGSSTDQVAVVPQGGAETGDGSTAGHTGWWVGGALLAGLAGLVTARRVRVSSRR